MSGYNPKVNEFLAKVKKWRLEMEQIREIALDCGLEEEFKWRQPCYAYQQNNIGIIGGFKDSCVFSFFKGSLLSDAHQILQAPGENSKASRLMRFTSLEEVIKLEPILRECIFEAIEIEKAGLKVDFSENKILEYTAELQDKLAKDTAFRSAFEGLTTGRKRAYNMYFSQAKQSKTRLARIEKYTPRILNGKGINDCVCGFSKRMPTCDGSHKYSNS